MNKRELKTAFQELLAQDVDLLPWEEKCSYLRGLIANADKDRKWPEPKKYEEWTDDQLRLVLSTAPTRENTIRLARAFGRGYGSIVQIRLWAGTDQKTVDRKRPDDKFVQQIKRIAREVGFRA